MELSLSVLTFSTSDRIFYLKKVLESFVNQQKHNLNWEFIILLFEPSQDILEMIGSYQSRLPLRVKISKEIFSRSNARNEVADMARGKVLTFLDSDVIVSPSFLSHFQKTILNTPFTKKFIIHYLFGYKIGYSKSEECMFLLDNLNEVDDFRHLESTEAYDDYREGNFKLCHDILMDLPAPALLGWSTIFSIARQDFCASGGFSEKFKDWGGEDTEFALRLYDQGVEFILSRECIGVHLPHPTASRNSNRNLEIRQKIFECHPSIATELFTYFNGLAVNPYLLSLQSLTYLNFRCDQTVIDKIVLLAQNREVLLLGCPIGQIRDKLDRNFHYFNALSNLSGLLGLVANTNKRYDQVILFGIYRYLSDELFVKVIKEMSKISDQVFFLVNTSFISQENEMETLKERIDFYGLNCQLI